MLCKALLHGNETRRCGEVDFKDVFAGSDLKYQVEGDRIKESIVIKEKQASYKYEFCIRIIPIRSLSIVAEGWLRSSIAPGLSSTIPIPMGK